MGQIAVKAPERTAFALVDEEDVDRLAGFRWFVGTHGYAVRNGPKVNGTKTQILMHRAIVGLEPGDPREADHKNRDRLDCRRSNLRIVTHAVNSRNVPGHDATSTYRGVSWDRPRDRWRAVATFDGHHHHLGRFAGEDAAAEAVNAFWVERGYEAPNAIAAA